MERLGHTPRDPKLCKFPIWEEYPHLAELKITLKTWTTEDYPDNSFISKCVIERVDWGWDSRIE